MLRELKYSKGGQIDKPNQNRFHHHISFSPHDAYILPTTES
jgi:hypothetical protein